MAPSSRQWIKGVVTTAGAAVAGPTGALIGTLVGGILQASLPGVGAFLGDVTANLASDAVAKASRKLVDGLAPPEVQRINHDLQSAFRDAFREALYDLGGAACFSQAWQQKLRAVPPALVYPLTPHGHHLWQQQAPLAGQVEALFQEMEQALDAQALLPMEPAAERPAGSALAYLHALSSAELAAGRLPGDAQLSARAFSDAFHDQMVAPFLVRYRTLLAEAPGLEAHLRVHLLDRTLVHFGELVKSRERAWRAFNRAVLEAVFQQGRELEQGQADILQRLETLTGSEESGKIADDLAALISTFGGMQKHLDSRFDELLAQSAAQQQVLLHHLEGLSGASRRIENKVERVLRILEDGRITVEGAPPVAVDEPPAAGESPFQGLQYFDVEDEERFFGRELLAARLVGRLRGSTFLAVVGASGSGKSSVVRAGLVPALKRGRPLADGTLPPAGSEHWPVYILTPTAHPLEALAAALTRENKSVRATAALRADLTDADGALQRQGLLLYVRKLLADKRRRGDKLLLVIDQFEELFTACKHPEERQCFLDNLLYAVADGLETPARVVIALRADFYAQCGQYEALRAALEAHQVFIGPMSADELRQAIEEPARLGKWEFEPGLVELILKDVGREPGALPLLSHALLETWRHRRGRMMTLESYAESGGVRGAVAQTAERVYQQLTDAEREIARRAFLRLTEPGEGVPDTRRRAQFAELLPETAAAASVRAVLKTLADARLLTLGEDTAEVAHEALIREWGTLQGWLDEDRQGLRIQRHITDAAADWVRLGSEPGELYRGARLAQALEWAEIHGEELTAREIEFLRASRQMQEAEAQAQEQQRQRELEQAQQLAEAQERRAQAEQERAEAQAHTAARLRRWAYLLGGALALALLAVALAVIFWTQAGRAADESARLADLNATAAVENARTAQTAEAASTLAVAQEATAVAERDLAAQARSEAEAARLVSEQKALLARAGELASKMQLAANPYLKTLLAIEALQRARQAGEARYPAAEETLMDYVTYSGGRSLEQSANVGLLRTTADGMWMAGSYSDGRVGLWDLRQPGSYTLWITLHSEGGGFNDLEFSPNGRWLASAHTNGNICLWDMLAITSDPSTDAIRCLQVQAHQHEVQDIVFSADSTWLVSGGQDGMAHIWDLSGAADDAPASAITLLLTLEDNTVYPDRASKWNDDNLNHNINQVHLTPDKRWLVTVGHRSVFLWNLAAGMPGASRLEAVGDDVMLVPGGVGALFSPDGRWLLNIGFQKPIELWDLASSNWQDGLPPRYQASSADSQISEYSFSPDGTQLALGDAGGMLQILDLSQGSPFTPLWKLNSQSEEIRWLVYSPDGKKLFAGAGWQIYLWDLTADNPDESRLAIYPQELSGEVRFGQTEFFTRNINEVRAWSLEQPLPRAIQSDLGRADAIVMQNDSARFYTANENGVIAAWKLQENQLVRERIVFQDANRYFNLLALSADNRWLAAGYRWDRGAYLIDLGTTGANGEHPWYFLDSGENNGPLSFDPQGRWLVTYGEPGTLELRELKGANPGAVVEVLGGFRDLVSGYAFDARGERLLAGSYDRYVRLWNLNSDPIMLEWITEFQGAEILAVTASPDGRWAATADMDGTVALVDLSNLPEWVAYFLDVEDSAQHLLFSPDSRWLLGAAWTNTPLLWDLQAKDPIYAQSALYGHTNELSAFAFSPDGKWLASGAYKESVRLWDLASSGFGWRSSALPMPQTNVVSLAFTPDSRWLVGGGEEATLRAWALDQDLLVDIACDRLQRNLWMDEWSQYLGEELYQPTCPQFPITQDIVSYYSDKGWDSYYSDDYAQAIVFLNHALLFSPEDAWVNRGLGKSYSELGNYTQALVYLEKALESSTIDEWLLGDLAAIYELMGDQQKAAEYEIRRGWYFYQFSSNEGKQDYLRTAELEFEQAIAHDPQNSEAYAGLGWVAYVQDDLIHAREQFAAALQINPDDVLALQGFGLVFRDEGDYELALEHFHRVLSRSPDDVKTLSFRAETYLKMEAYAEFSADIEHIHSLNPAYVSPHDYSNLGEAYLKLRNYERAEWALAELAARAESPVDGQLDAGWVYYDAGEYARAIQSFDQALALEPSSKNALKGLGWSNYHLGEYQMALDKFLQAAAIDPEDTNALDGLGWSYYRLGEYASAVETFLQAATLSSEYLDVLVGLGWSYYRLDEHAQAVETFSQALVIEADYADALQGRGWAGFELGNYAQVATDLERVLELKPGRSHQMDYEILGMAYARLGQAEQAEETFLKLLEAYDDPARAYSRIGWSYWLVDDYVKSQIYFEKSLAANADYYDAYLGLGNVAYSQELWADALQAYQRYLELAAEPSDWVLRRVQELQEKRI